MLNDLDSPEHMPHMHGLPVRNAINQLIKGLREAVETHEVTRNDRSLAEIIHDEVQARGIEHTRRYDELSTLTSAQRLQAVYTACHGIKTLYEQHPKHREYIKDALRKTFLHHDQEDLVPNLLFAPFIIRVASQHDYPYYVMKIANKETLLIFQTLLELAEDLCSQQDAFNIFDIRIGYKHDSHWSLTSLITTVFKSVREQDPETYKNLADMIAMFCKTHMSSSDILKLILKTEHINCSEVAGVGIQIVTSPARVANSSNPINIDMFYGRIGKLYYEAARQLIQEKGLANTLATIRQHETMNIPSSFLRPGIPLLSKSVFRYEAIGEYINLAFDFWDCPDVAAPFKYLSYVPKADPSKRELKKEAAIAILNRTDRLIGEGKTFQALRMLQFSCEHETDLSKYLLPAIEGNSLWDKLTRTEPDYIVQLKQALAKVNALHKLNQTASNNTCLTAYGPQGAKGIDPERIKTYRGEGAITHSSGYHNP